MPDLYLFSSDTKPATGGVAEFTHQIAKALQDLDRFGALVTPHVQTGDLPYPVWAPAPPPALANPGDSPVRSKLRALWMWGSLLHCGVRIALRGAGGSSPVLLVTYVDALFGPWVLWFCEITGLRLWVLFHGVEIIRLQERRPGLLRNAHAQAERLLFNSEATRDLFAEQTGLPAASSDILHPALDFEKLEATEPAPLPVDIPADATVFSSVCRLVERKGLHLAIRAFREARDAGTLENTLYLIGGTGPEIDRLRTLAGPEEERSIFFLGYLSEGEKKTLLTRSTAFLHPNYSCNRTDFEGFGISLVEAAWFGCAVLGGKQGGVPEAIGPLPGCELADTEDADRAVTQIRQFIEERTAGTDPAPERSETRRLIHDRLDLKAQLEGVLAKR
ncbi:glycosyltransferase family 4 protein [Salinibacter ruber]|uniref:glycosyltransferase family 4 protein n=1 Tax=Salinibacter ruber TaxID=146919 RepID=UPI00216965D0|nr:glycosyltransferase involved in cell wall biosynthesis [Salinibacter ruber]